MKIATLFYIVNIILSFISRSIFIKILGADITGLNSLYTSLINFLNVAELGVGVAVGYSLYKPLSEKNYKKINDIMSLFKHYYKNIAIIILVIGIIISGFLPFLIKGQVDIFHAYIYYYIYLFNCVISYLFTYKQTLIIADQKQYKILYTLNFCKIFKILIQCIAIYITKSFMVWLLVEVIFNIVSMMLTNKKIDFEYRNKILYKNNVSIERIKAENYQIGETIKNIFFHKIGIFVIFQTDSIVISLFSTLKETGIYANYMMIINALSGLLANAIGSIMPGIGNLIAEESREKVYKTFRKLYLFDHLIAIIITISTYKLIDSFIVLWIGKEYLFSKSCTLIIIINLYIQISRGSVDRFKDGFGIYWDIYAPITESVLNIIFSVVLAWKIGIIGVFIGTLVSNIIIIGIWKPYILFRNGFKKNISKYVVQTIVIYTKNIFIIFVFNLIYNIITKYILINNIFISFVFNGIITVFICLLLVFILYGSNREFQEIVKLINNNIILPIKNKIIKN